MKSNSVQQIWDLIGIDLKDGRSRVLKAILSAQSEIGSGCTFDELRTTLLEMTGGKEIARPLIYRYLKSLEKDMLIQVDRNSNPNLYLVDITILSEGLESLKDCRIEQLEALKDRLANTLSNLVNVDASWLARDLTEMLVGAPFESGSRSTHGQREIHELIGSEVYSRARKGDLVRVTLDWDFDSPGEEGKKRELGYTLFSRGIRMRFLLHNPDRVNQGLLRDRLLEYRRILSHEHMKELVETRVSFKKTKTYQTVALNRDGIVLIVSEEPPTAVWVPRLVNPKLVDDVIDSYDDDFNSSIDFLEFEERM